MSKVIVVTSGKGGVGKTTTAANIGVGLALHGQKTALIDADIGLRNLDLVIGLENRIVYNIIDVAEGNCRLKQALIRDKRFDCLFLLPAAQTRDKSAINPEQMKAIVAELLEKEKFEYVIIDCPAGIETGFKNAIAAAEYAIVVTTPEVSAVRDADRVIGLLNASDREYVDVTLIVNRIRPDMVRRGDMMTIEDIDEILAIELLGIIPDDENIVVATNRGEPVITNQASVAGQAYKNIVQRLMGEEVPFMSLEKDNSIWAKMKKVFVRS